MSVADDLDPIRDQLIGLGRAHTPADVALAMKSAGEVVTDESLLETLEALRRESVGAGRLEPLLRAEGVTDVLVNGPHRVYVDRGHGLELTDVRFRDEAELRRLAQRLAASVGRRLDEAAPFVDARLGDGTRVHAVLATLAAPGTCLSLRVPARRTFSLRDCVSAGSLSHGAAQLLGQIVESRLAFLVSGGTGSGKTTLLAALLSLVPPAERMVIVEDSRELAPDHPHVIRLECRPPNAERAGAVTLTDLVRQSLRMRPDRLVVGEVRGAEICDLLTAMNTGHEGGCGTVHANSATDVPARLEALAALGRLRRDALHAQLAAALDVVIHLRRDPTGQRRVAEIHVLVRDPRTGLVATRMALSFGSDGTVQRGPGSRRMEALVGR
ncbi:TadA family conjugal transfer-associated ATPase [Microlunatus panaciterrae]|uniref:Pilus assembly protein CpaF n=1 Tax=Microlunatus panaciterrae TaxID=400768 RepID=A0ABS2RKH5_9ACTN|nr:TadA family conjugal transfer-associated ATPase [Microlunatus panaciterrae]MBM7799223.1 pilus assembly protein CpaF [Microlunatus panaciterrae]